MKRILALIGILTAAAAIAQELPTSPAPGATDSMERLERFIREWQMEHDSAPWRCQLLERRAAEERRRDFVEKANRFVAIWKRVMGSYARDGVFNVKEARALSKAFRELEATGWPK